MVQTFLEFAEAGLDAAQGENGVNDLPMNS
jgi:hypothetical protein